MKITSADKERQVREMQAAQRERERELSAQSKREESSRMSDTTQQLPVKVVRKIYTELLVRYVGPVPKSYRQYNVRYRLDKELCKAGWCHDEFAREVAMGAFLDRSDTHNLAPAGMERAVDIDLGLPTLEKEKAIVYGSCGRLVVTDHVLVACCHKIGTFLVKLRRNCRDQITDGRYSTSWDKVSNFSSQFTGEEIRLICAQDPELGKVENLKVFEKMLSYLGRKQTCYAQKSNRLLL
jgi:hypothetical protein